MGKVAIIPDMGAVTYVQYGFLPVKPCSSLAHPRFEALLHYLYTGEIKFAPLSSDPRQELSAETRTGDWSAGRLPSPSAKSIYRLADKVTGPDFTGFSLTHKAQYDIPTLKKQAKAHICDNLGHCDIVEEVFSGFNYA